MAKLTTLLVNSKYSASRRHLFALAWRSFIPVLLANDFDPFLRDGIAAPVGEGNPVREPIGLSLATARGEPLAFADFDGYKWIPIGRRPGAFLGWESPSIALTHASSPSK